MLTCDTEAYEEEDISTKVLYFDLLEETEFLREYYNISMIYLLKQKRNMYLHTFSSIRVVVAYLLGDRSLHHNTKYMCIFYIPLL